MIKSLIARLGRFFVTCQDASELTLAECDRSLGRAERVRLRIHRWLCGSCQRYQQQVELMQAATKRFRDVATEIREPVLSADSKTRLRKSLQTRIDYIGHQE